MICFLDFFYNYETEDGDGHKCYYKTITCVGNRDVFICACDRQWNIICSHNIPGILADRKNPKQWKDFIDEKEKEMKKLQCLWPSEIRVTGEKKK